VEKIDATVILNLHKEGLFLKRTLLSLDVAVKHAADAGLNIQLVAILDRADETTRKVMVQHDAYPYASVSILEVNNGSLGLSRNDGIEAATGEYIITADGDDLISQNYILDTITTASSGPQECLYFPEFLFAFGNNYHISVYRPLHDATPLALFDMHPFTSRVCAHKSVFARFKYDDLRLTKGYAFEDWHYNANAVANGLDIRIVPGTILFYRQRTNSLLQQANAISARQIAPSKLFEPLTWLERCKPYMREIQASTNIHLRAQPATRSILDCPNIQKWVRKANSIESMIQMDRFVNSAIFTNAQSALDAGIAYYNICELLADLTFDNVFLFPFISKGGAEKYFLEILHSLYRQYPEKNCLVIMGEDFDGPTWCNQLPPNAITIDLQYMSNNLTPEARQIIALKLIEATAKTAHIHIRHSVFGDNFLQNFGMLFSDQVLAYYRFSDPKAFVNGHEITRHSPLELISETLDSLTYVVTDNETVAEKDTERLGAFADKWKVLRAPIAITRSEHSSQHNRLNQILWASRLDYEKRPAIVAQIADSLNKYNSNPRITAYGSSVFQEYTPAIFDGHANLKYAGPYDGFASLPTEKYGVFIYTSLFDGVPNVLLEAMAAGLVVIAPDVGGISEIIKDGETGILLPSLANDTEMAESYAKAIIDLSENQEFAIKLSNNAIHLLQQRNSYQVYDKEISELFSSRN